MAAIRRWVVRSDPIGKGWHAWFYVYFYETTAELQRAATKYSIHDNKGFHNAAAVFHPHFSYRVNNKGKIERTAKTAFIGIMRLSMENLAPHIVIHESAHAAVHYVHALRLNSEYVIGRNIDTEEALAYATHEFADSLLRKLGVYQ